MKVQNCLHNTTVTMAHAGACQQQQPLPKDVCQQWRARPSCQACPAGPKPCPCFSCPAIKDPVCGADGKTYP